jgi:uncharacterized lipoprotein YmbA
MRQASLSRRLLIAGLAFAALTSGCTSPPSRRFLLAPRGAGAAAAPSFAGRVAIAGIGIAKYLDQPEIVRHHSGYELAVAEFEIWAEGVADMVGRVLAEDLAARLPGGTVFVGDGAATVPADTSLELYIDRFDADPDGMVVLNSRWTIRRGSGAPRLGAERITARPASPGTPDLVAAMSDALAALADRLAAQLA